MKVSTKVLIAEIFLLASFMGLVGFLLGYTLGTSGIALSGTLGVLFGMILVTAQVRKE